MLSLGSCPTPRLADRLAALSAVSLLSLVVATAATGCDPLAVNAVDQILDGIRDSGTPPPLSPCALVDCAVGTHCEEQAVTCVKAPCPPVATCVPNADRLSCGGIAGIKCPGGGECVDDPTDSCDPRSGGADCGGLCLCVQTVACAKDQKFDSSLKVCGCVPAAAMCGPVCDIYCAFGNVLDAQGCPTCKCNPAPTPTSCPPEKCTGPAPKSANYVCPDGVTLAGPACQVGADGSCGWTVVACPATTK